MCGTIEQDPEGGHSFVKRKDLTLRLVVQKLDSPDEEHPSLDELEKAHFACQALGDLDLWSIPTMRWGERPEADPNCSPTVAAYQINLARDGLVFSMHSHHYASDVMSWSNFTHQLADNCYAIANSTPFPPWDPKCNDVARFTRDLPEEELVDGPPIPQRHPDHPEQQCILVHLPKSKANQLKEQATPSDPAAQWISTYDGMCAYIWRLLSKAVNMRPRIHNPPVPERMLRNVLAGAFSDTAPVPAPTAGEVISEAPLSKLAGYIRALTESCTEQHLENLIAAIAPIRDKRSISLRVDAHPPMSMSVTDHRSGDGSLITAGLILVYAPIRSGADPDEGCMFTFTMEKELVPKLLEDSEWNAYFDYRGGD
ncbi:Uu.00g010860.m01.CDS01 [Anthostomella pinea]|uniref:Uu.00g010860.m01.CDS01 n=1 Tax=Anthostomella pinea TaxID=933095 RepID=A0AAI8VXN0_9PEZI|nr:Uu.00g010860.m01.CDS01 [Anthostomella pinea]